MHKDLEQSFNKMVDILKIDKRCLGGWHFGSVGRNMTDEYSDYDPIFLVKDKDFNQFAADVPNLMTQISDELLLCWAENFNNDHFKNYCNIIQLGESLHQLDFFILNYDYPDEWLCKLHCKGCTKEQIIFDRVGETADFLDRGYSVENNIPDTIRVIDTYWFHIIQIIKYFKRNDVFKLLKNVDFLFHAHVDLLLSQYSTLDWGGWDSKIKHCVPSEKQEHLKAYFTSADIDSLEAAVKKSIWLFKSDAEEICAAKGIEYPQITSQKITDCFYKRLDR